MKEFLLFALRRELIA